MVSSEKEIENSGNDSNGITTSVAGGRLETVELEPNGDEGIMNRTFSPKRGGTSSYYPVSFAQAQAASSSDFWQTIAGVAGNVLEWYDFAVFGYMGDVIGKVFFPPQAGDNGTMEAFAVFGAAFLMRPIGGVMMGYVGDVYGRDKALIISIFLMAFPTFAMGCLPSYERIGNWATFLLIAVRLLQGLSVGGQIMSSLVFTLENHERSQWGLYGSFVMAAANFGSLLGGIVSYILRSSLSEESLMKWGWRIPFLSGIVVSVSGLYLKSHTEHHKTIYEEDMESHSLSSSLPHDPRVKNPVAIAFSPGNLRSLLSATLVPMLWSSGFYLSFVWLAVFMAKLSAHTMSRAFGINCLSLLISVCLFFPYAGHLSDRFGRVKIMTIGGVGMGIFGPLVIFLVNLGNGFVAFLSQSTLGILLSLWGAPMCAWLVESFEPQARLTSVSIGYNMAHAIAGSSAPFLATLMVDRIGPNAPGMLLTILSTVSLAGLCIAPSHAESERSNNNLHRSGNPLQSGHIKEQNLHEETELV